MIPYILNYLESECTAALHMVALVALLYTKCGSFPEPISLLQD